MKIRGWEIQLDPTVLEQYPSISKDYFQGKLGDLYFKSHQYPAGFEIEFYQNINTINKDGGQHDFNKLELMPYLIKKRFTLELSFIRTYLINRHYSDRSEPSFKYSLDEVLHRIKSSWHYEEGKEKPEFDIPEHKAKDKNGKIIKNGQVKYYYGYKGVLMRGTVYHNINNMWWVILNKHDYTNIASFDLFDLADEDTYVRKLYSREIPNRVKAEKLRNKFNEKYGYNVLNESHINHLRLLVSSELTEHFDEEMRMTIRQPKKKDTKVLKTQGLKYARIEVDGSYFTGREGITFSSTGFIGFAGWASGRNVKPFVDAFEKWLDWLDSNQNLLRIAN